MRKRPEVVAAIAAGSVALVVFVAFVPAARAQPNLPPPPPPPIDSSPAAPSLPPPPPGPGGSMTSPSSPPRRPPPTTRPRATPPSPRPRRTEEAFEAPPPPPSHAVAVTLNPLGLFWGRLSANVEVQVLPHHSLFVSPNLLLWHADRGGPDNLISEGLGFASPTSLGVGAEVGYHYWWAWSRELRGPFIGPAVLFGGTSHAQVGDPSHLQAYWGVAADLGWQEVVGPGFTAGVGVGLELIGMAGNVRGVPRGLLQLGWEF